MDTTRQAVFSGNLRGEYEQQLQAIHQEKLFNRLKEHDVTLWPCGEAGTAHLKSNLEFLHIPEKLAQWVSGPLQADAEAQAQGLTHRVVIAFGSVHHYCEALLNIHPDTKNLKCLVLDSCHPRAIRRVEAETEAHKTLIVLVNKSGYRLEDHALFLYFHKKLETALPGQSAGHFVAGSEANTFLANTATEYRFRYFLELPAGILAPYCSVIYLGLLLPALAGVEPEVLRIACREMKRTDLDTSSSNANPVSEIGALLVSTAESGRPFVHFLATPSLAPFALGLCRLAGDSLGRKEAGLFPLASTIPCATEHSEGAASFVVLRNGEKDEPEVAQCVAGLRSRNAPFLEMTIANPLDLLRHTFRWQMATVLAAARMGLDPFESRDSSLSLTLAGEMLNELSPRNDSLQRRPRIQEGRLQLFAEGEARRRISQLNLAEGLVSFFENRQAAAYVGLFVFLNPCELAQTHFTALREELSQALKLPVLLTWGPRSLDTFDCLLQEGGPPGLHLVITSDTEFDVTIPGANYSFGQMYRALAIGQFEALSTNSGLALRLHLASPWPEAFAQLQKTITQALRRLGP